MVIKKATQQDLIAIGYLLSEYGDKMSMPISCINYKDIALQAREENGDLVGFVWCGLMAKGKLGYIDFFVTSPKCSKRGLGRGLLKALLLECKKRGVHKVFGTVRNDEFHTGCAITLIKSAFEISPHKYTIGYSEVNKSLKNLQDLEV